MPPASSIAAESDETMRIARASSARDGSLAEDQRPDSRCDELADELVERHALLGQQLLAQKNLAVEEDELHVDVLGVVAAKHAIERTDRRVD